MSNFVDRVKITANQETAATDLLPSIGKSSLSTAVPTAETAAAAVIF